MLACFSLTVLKGEASIIRFSVKPYYGCLILSSDKEAAIMRPWVEPNYSHPILPTEQVDSYLIRCIDNKLKEIKVLLLR